MSTDLHMQSEKFHVQLVRLLQITYKEEGCELHQSMRWKQ